MLSKKYKISREEFPKNDKNGLFYNSKNLTLTVKKAQKPSKNTKFSFIVSKKVAKSAVLRNKMKRRGYYAAKKLINSTKPSILAIFMLKRGVDSIPYQEFEDQIVFLLKKAKILDK